MCIARAKYCAVCTRSESPLLHSFSFIKYSRKDPKCYLYNASHLRFEILMKSPSYEFSIPFSCSLSHISVLHLSSVSHKRPFPPILDAPIVLFMSPKGVTGSSKFCLGCFWSFHLSLWRQSEFEASPQQVPQQSTRCCHRVRNSCRSSLLKSQSLLSGHQ